MKVFNLTADKLIIVIINNFAPAINYHNSDN